MDQLLYTRDLQIVEEGKYPLAEQTWRLLLVEDDEDDCFLVKTMLSKAKGLSFDLQWAPTYQEAQRQLNAKHFDAVLVDYDLGAYKGIELIREISAMSMPIPVIFLMASGWYDTAIEAVQVGAALYIPKEEISSSLLERAIRYTIERKQAHDGLQEVDIQRRILAGREMERKQMARDLHDGPVQDLLNLNFLLQDAFLDVQDPKLSETLTRVRDEIQKVVNELRKNLSELRPPMMLKFGLAQAIAAHQKELLERYGGITVRLDLMEDSDLLPEEVRLAFYRIYQSAIHNVIHHARASEIKVKFILASKEATLEIQDDGVGFADPSNWLLLEKKGHLGLIGMRERAEAIHGTFFMQSQPDQGTLVRISAPLEN